MQAVLFEALGGNLKVDPTCLFFLVKKLSRSNLSRTEGDGEIRKLQRQWAERIGARLMCLHTKYTIMGPIFPRER